MVAILLALFREMGEHHYGVLINHFKYDEGAKDLLPKQKLSGFINDVLVVMKSFFHTSYFPKDWSQMTILQNR